MDESTRRTPTTQQDCSLKERLDAVRPDRPVVVMVRGHKDLKLRPMEPSDRVPFINLVHVSLDHLRPWLPSLADGTTPEAFFQQELRRSQDAENQRNALRLVAECSGQLVGSFALINITRGLTLQADASWWIGRPYIQQGLATRGLAQLLKQAFATPPTGLGLHRVMATIAPDNEPSLKLARRFGFFRRSQEDHHLRIGDAWVKHHCFAADAHEYDLREMKPLASSQKKIPLQRDPRPDRLAQD